MKTLAIVGASGLVGGRLVDIVNDKHPDVAVRLFGNNSVGSKIEVLNRRVTVESCERITYGKIDYAAFMANEEIAKRYVPMLAQTGVTCIDNSSFFRLKKDVPLVVPCINGDTIANSKIIANPNCTTIQVVLAVNALAKLEPVKITVSTYQSASGAGKEGMCDLNNRATYGRLKCFAHPLYDNLIPCIGKQSDKGITAEELKMINESRKILRMPHLKVNSFCCRVPVSVCHGAFVNVQFRNRTDVNAVRNLLLNAPNVLLMDGEGVYPMPTTLRNTKYVGVGRIYTDPTNNKAINMFVVADNLLRGAAYNAYEILEEVIKRDREINA